MYIYMYVHVPPKLPQVIQYCWQRRTFSSPYPISPSAVASTKSPEYKKYHKLYLNF